MTVVSGVWTPHHRSWVSYRGDQLSPIAELKHCMTWEWSGESWTRWSWACERLTWPQSPAIRPGQYEWYCKAPSGTTRLDYYSWRPARALRRSTGPSFPTDADTSTARLWLQACIFTSQP